MPNSKLSRNAEYVSNAQLSQASSPENRPLDSTKTLYKEQWLKLLGVADQIKKYIEENNSRLKTKE
jgi:hypothetical protein